MWKKTIVIILAALIFLGGGFLVGYVVQNGGLTGLPALLGFGNDEEEQVAWANKTLTTGENIVNVRVTPSNDGQILATLNKNTEVACLRDENDDWCYVRVMDGVEGYVIKSFMTIVGDYTPTEDTETPADTPTEPGFVTPVGDVVNIRSEANENSEVVGVALNGDVLEKTGEEEGWVQVKSADGVEGYISADLVEETEAEEASNAERRTVTITNSYANIRSEPSSDSTQITRMNQGETATYLGEENGWYYMMLDDGQRAYVRSDLASVSD
ncbi:MAG: SH3 domain-containing protein [Bacillota bacterium]|nr:SH3 domain-containing protein [Bacillota bacterium]